MSITKDLLECVFYRQNVNYISVNINVKWYLGFYSLFLLDSKVEHLSFSVGCFI